MPAHDPFDTYKVTEFYHFTDRRNLAKIRETGGLYSLVELEKRKITVPQPGGNEWSHDADAQKGLNRYVHLCFRRNHPMEYIARQEGRIGQSVFLEIHPDILSIDGVLFAADVSNKSGVTTCGVTEALKWIDFEVLYTRTDWSNADIQARLRHAEKCEILVPNHVPLKYIRNFPNG